MWRYDRPKKKGYYYCTLMAKNIIYSGKRQFGDLTNVINDYRMKGEPLRGLGWIRDPDGFKDEKVIAWSENEQWGVCDKIPEGAVVVSAARDMLE